MNVYLSYMQMYMDIQSWTFIGRSDAEAPVLWPPHAKN